MTYSDTAQTYVVVVSGFDPQVGAARTIGITTSLGLATPIVSVNRARIPPAATDSIFSIDGYLQLTPVSSDTFDFLTYVAIVPSFGPHGPAPLGHRFVGSTYSVRASGNLTETTRPMLLDISFDEAALAGADPHSLAIFAWDEDKQRWDNLGGQLLSGGGRRSVSVATTRFTAYALMAAPSWQDDFDDFNLGGLSQRSNVEIGPLGDNLALVLSSMPGGGAGVSLPISPTTAFAQWDRLSFAADAAPPTTTLTVDVLSVTGTVVLSNVMSGADLAGIDPARYPALKLRVNLSSTVAGATPALDWWRLTWRPQADKPRWYRYVPLVMR